MPDPIEYSPNEIEIFDEEYEIGLATVRGDKLHIVELVHFDVKERGAFERARAADHLNGKGALPS